MKNKKEIRFYNFTITYKEIIASVSIFTIMILIGILIHQNIESVQTEKDKMYDQAVKIESQDLFEYGMRTNVGNAFVYGDLKAIDTVSYPEIDGQYMSVTKVKEKYTKHTKTVTKTKKDSNGKTVTYTDTEEYYSWDVVDKERIHCDKVSFLNVEFDYEQIYQAPEIYIDTQKEWGNIRYVYYGAPTEYTGTIFTSLKDNTVNNTKFYNSMNIQETIDYLKSDVGTIVFWILYIPFIGLCIWGFCYLDNKWLE